MSKKKKKKKAAKKKTTSRKKTKGKRGAKKAVAKSRTTKKKTKPGKKAVKKAVKKAGKKSAATTQKKKKTRKKRVDPESADTAAEETEAEVKQNTKNADQDPPITDRLSLIRSRHEGMRRAIDQIRADLEVEADEMEIPE